MSVAYPTDSRILNPSATSGAVSINLKTMFSAIGSTNRSPTKQVKDPFSVSGQATQVLASHLEDQLNEYEMYDIPDWDGYGASPITKSTVDAARGFRHLLPRSVPTPDIAPGADGTIGFEWRSGPASARTFKLVDIGPDNLITARVVRGDGSVDAIPPTRLGEGDRALIRQLFR